ncbi:MAG: type VI secretion system baseplate subunit TssE [Desulfobacteraceae bacterium]|nr:type VI secretion system baseplate subunit TssE [Desulfobacteraceae bacterium]MBC2754358.1 type VI secretion system baseplate subunit TssE [Desulfobacteraceae bacterium]
MREERLIERIRLREKQPDRSTTEDPKKIISSVLRHLQKVLNTRQGGVQIAEDFGMPDLTDYLRGYPASLRDVEKSLRQTIIKYEPRLKAVRVKFVPQEEDLLSLNFQIIARLAGEHSDQPVVFESQVDSDGRISIRG